MNAAIITGGLPQQLKHMTVKLIDKKAGGFRPIILYRSIYRLLGRILGIGMRAWERVALKDLPFDNNAGRQP